MVKAYGSSFIETSAWVALLLQHRAMHAGSLPAEPASDLLCLGLCLCKIGYVTTRILRKGRVLEA